MMKNIFSKKQKRTADSPEKEEKTDKPQKRKRGVILILLFGFLFSLTVAIFSASIYYQYTFDIQFNDFLFTLLSPLAGTGKRTMIDILSAILLPAMIAIIPYAIFVFCTRKGKAIHSLLKRIGAVSVLVALVFSLTFSVFALRIPEYLAHYGEKSMIYEEKYIDPNSVAITDRDGNARNLIYIYLESLETTYASQEAGGAQNKVNYMPHMTELAKDNISFSNSENLGGFHSVTGTGWTMGALLGTTSGIPFSLEIFGAKSHNKQGKDGTFLNGLTTLGDILAEKGYQNKFLIGSDAAFAGTNTYLSIHGGYEIFDLHTARKKGYVPPNYHNDFWGFEDQYLYQIAKDELTALATQDTPFNFTMMTIDTHHPGGYTCKLCQNEYPKKTGNVIACADRQLYDFIKWCQTQDFYENTTIIITGDHPRMDPHLVKGVSYYDRTIYNCILNAAADTPHAQKNRTFTSLDMFPTTLAAMGFEIEGNRLGLGTNLFSTLPTLCEEMGDGKEGYDRFDEEVKKESDYYKENFLKKE